MATRTFAHPLLIAWVLAGVIAAATQVLAICGDGILDPGEQCDHGAANGNDDCCSATCQSVDIDGDGQCDAIDPCNNGLGIRIKDAILRIRGLTNAPGDDTINFAGTLTVPVAPTIDPVSSGIRLTTYAPFGDPRGSTAIDVTVPGGPKWRASSNGTSWRYRDPAGDAGGITRVAMKLLPPLDQNPIVTKVAFSLSGRRGRYPLTPVMVTFDYETFTGSALQVTFTLGSGSLSTLQCANVYYTMRGLTHCGFTPSGDGVTCRGPRPVGPCHTGDPDNLIICDAENAARAENAYFSAHGTYYGGDCTGMPTFVPSPGVSCNAFPITSGFVISTRHPQETYVGGCTYTSVDSDPLVCG